jgi:CTP:molybdopterin cytidylyltransferase MocA
VETVAGVEAVVLAAGASTRLGRPKALLEFEGRTALELVMAALRAAGVRAGVIVTGGESGEAIRRAVDPSPLGWARNPMPEAGRTGSVLVGLAATTPSVDTLLWPVDRPLASAATVRALLEARAGCVEGEGVIVPEADGRRGHPLVIRAFLREALLAAPPDANLREVFRDTGTRRREVPVDDPGIHFDLDTEADWERALAWWRQHR